MIYNYCFLQQGRQFSNLLLHRLVMSDMHYEALTKDPWVVCKKKWEDLMWSLYLYGWVSLLFVMIVQDNSGATACTSKMCIVGCQLGVLALTIQGLGRLRVGGVDDRYNKQLLHRPRTVPTEVMFFSSDKLLPRTRLVPNKRLPANNAGFDLPGVYRASLLSSAFEEGGQGLFTNLEACERSSEVGMMFEFTSSSSPEFEEEFLEAMVAERPHSSHTDFTKMNLPKEMMNILNAKNVNVKLETVEASTADVSSTTQGAKVKGDPDEAKTAALFSELEEALKSIH